MITASYLSIVYFLGTRLTQYAICCPVGCLVRLLYNDCIKFSLDYFLEIPDFLTKEECEHIIRKATETGLALSEVKLPDEEITTDKFASEKLFNLVKNVLVFFCLLVCLYYLCPFIIFWLLLIYLFFHHHVHSLKATVNNKLKSYRSSQWVIVIIKVSKKWRRDLRKPPGLYWEVPSEMQNCKTSKFRTLYWDLFFDIRWQD